MLDIPESNTSDTELKNKPTSENSKIKIDDKNPLKPPPYSISKQALTAPKLLLSNPKDKKVDSDITDSNNATRQAVVHSMDKQTHKSDIIKEPVQNINSLKHQNTSLDKSRTKFHNNSSADKHMGYKLIPNKPTSSPMTIKTIDPITEIVQNNSTAKDDNKAYKIEDNPKPQANKIPALANLDVNKTIPSVAG